MAGSDRVNRSAAERYGGPAAKERRARSDQSEDDSPPPTSSRHRSIPFIHFAL
jgi:hypothetical protein